MHAMQFWPLLLVVARACQQNYTPCAPPGATSTALPAVGPALAPLYTALLSAVKDVKPPPEPNSGGGGNQRIELRGTDQFCCAETTACLKLDAFKIPLCYDKFTSNFRFYDDSDGVLVQGTLNLANGPVVDMIHGNYAGGGNIYGNNPPPNTATLPLPTPYTASGVGSAIPLTNLGGIATVTTTIPGTTVTGTTEPGSSYASVTVENGATTTISTASPGTTVPGLTIPPKTLTITVTAAPSSTSSAAAPEGPHQVDLGTKFAWAMFVMLFA